MIQPCKGILNDWAAAPTYNDLLQKVCNGFQANPESSQLDLIVNNFIKSHRFGTSDLEALKKLQGLIKQNPGVPDNNFSNISLEKTIAAVSKTLKSKSIQPAIELSSIKTPSAITQYLLNQLHKNLPVSKSEIDKYEEGSIHFFIKDLLSANDADKKMMQTFIRQFFEHADYSQRNIMFNLTCYYDRTHVDFFSFVVTSLQANTSEIIIQSEYIKDCHVEFILRHFKDLETLNFSYCKNLTNKTAFNIANTSLPKLTKLVLRGNEWLNDAMPGAIDLVTSLNYPNLKDLQLQNCPNITDLVPILLSINTSMQKLEHLRFSYCEKMTIKAFEAIFDSKIMLNLKTLEVASFSTLSPELFLRLKDSSIKYNLTKFSFSSSEDLTNELFLAFINSSLVDNIEYLDLVGCSQLSRESFEAFAKSAHISKLRHLDLRECHVAMGFVTALANNPKASNLEKVSLTSAETKKDMTISFL